VRFTSGVNEIEEEHFKILPVFFVSFFVVMVSAIFLSRIREQKEGASMCKSVNSVQLPPSNVRNHWLNVSLSQVSSGTEKKKDKGRKMERNGKSLLNYLKQDYVIEKALWQVISFH